VPFTPLAEHQLVTLDDDALIAHARAAREVGHGEQAALAIRVLVFAHWSRVVRRVGLKVPKEDVDDVAAEVVFSAIRSAFDGSSTGEFVAWLNTITKRRIADYHRRREDRSSTDPLDGGDTDEPAIEIPDPSEAGYVEAQIVIKEVLATLSDEHREAIELHVLEDIPAKEVAARLGLSEDNVAQIASRFRKKLRVALEGGDGS
jgi:RNA polymerase sigma-70 factor (ECF subfamily)